MIVEIIKFQNKTVEIYYTDKKYFKPSTHTLCIFRIKEKLNLRQSASKQKGGLKEILSEFPARLTLLKRELKAMKLMKKLFVNLLQAIFTSSIYCPEVTFQLKGDFQYSGELTDTEHSHSQTVLSLLAIYSTTEQKILIDGIFNSIGLTSPNEIGLSYEEVIQSIYEKERLDS